MAFAALKLLFVVDPIDEFKIYKDSSYAMMAEATQRGHAVFVCETRELWMEQRGHQFEVLGHCRQLALLTSHMQDRHLAGPWYSVSSESDASLTSFDAIVMRKDPPFDAEFLYATYLLERAQSAGARVFNRPAALREHNEKLGITEFGQFTSPTLVSRDPQRLRAFVELHQHVVLKLLDGMGGASIFHARSDDPNLSVIIETMNQFGARSVMAQKYLPAILQGDKRILLIDGKPVPYSLARIPKAGESRGNLAAGGRGEARPLSDRDLEIATTLGPTLAARGLLLVGLDVIGDCLTEVNVTSPTCFQEITDQTGFNVAGMFLDALEQASHG
jgi:glutathione synthase